MEKFLNKIKSLHQTSTIDRLENPPNGVPRYNINGEGYYSVTQILDDGKFGKVDPQRMLHSLTLGSVVHLQIENYFRKMDIHTNIESVLEEKQWKLYNFLTEATNEEWDQYLTGIHSEDDSLEEIVLKNRINMAFDQFLEFKKDYNIELVFTEEVIWHPDYLYAGTIDLVCLMDGELTIIDHKTSRFVEPSKTADDSYTAQLSAYYHALMTLENEKELDINLRILHLNPIRNTYSLIKRDYNFKKFLDALSRFSQETKTDQNSIELDKEKGNVSEKGYKYLKFDCEEKKCREMSTFPILEDLSFYIENKINRLVKVAFHENENHFVVYHISIPSLKIIRSFTHDLT